MLYTPPDMQAPMQRPDASPQTGFTSPRWQRTVLPTVAFLCAFLGLLNTGFLRFEWLPWFCMGCVYILGVPRQRGEPL